jgi:hypothetical protein
MSFHSSQGGPEFKMGRATDYDLSHLPPPNTKRWVVSRKMLVVDAVRKGLLTLADACARYTLSEEEIRSWMKLCEKGGARALRVTRLQDYRRKFRGELRPEVKALAAMTTDAARS